MSARTIAAAQEWRQAMAQVPRRRAAFLRALRADVARGESQSDLARALGMTRQRVHNFLQEDAEGRST